MHVLKVCLFFLFWIVIGSRILSLRTTNTKVDGVGVSLNFVSRGIQPCMERVHLAYEFLDEDFVREVPERLERGEITIRASKLFSSDMIIKNNGQPMAYSLGNPHPKVTKSN